jgi:hypothetical protein
LVPVRKGYGGRQVLSTMEQAARRPKATRVNLGHNTGSTTSKKHLDSNRPKVLLFHFFIQSEIKVRSWVRTPSYSSSGTTTRNGLI